MPTGDPERREVHVGANADLVTEDDLRDIASRTRSWRGVLRAVGLTGTGVARTLRARADEWVIDDGHFGYQHGGPAELRRVVADSRSWKEVLDRLGYAADSGSARANVRRQCRAQGIAFDHLDGVVPVETPFDRPVKLARLREAGGCLVAAAASWMATWPCTSCRSTSSRGRRRSTCATASSTRSGDPDGRVSG